MITYENFKTWIGENKQKVVVGVCFVLVFVVGFGTGRFDREYSKASTKQQPNYTTNTKAQATTKTTTTAAVAGDGVVAGAATKTASASATGDCIVKGNISANGKIYHVVGGASYKTVKPEQCFNTEAEAVAAGFVKSKR